MNVYTQCCGILLLLTILWFYGRQKRLHLNTGSAFFKTLICALFSISADALSIVAICNRDCLSDVFVRSICKTYLASLVLLAFCAVYYICTDIYTKRLQQRKAVYCNGIIGIAAMLMIYASPIHIYCDMGGKEVYTYGPSVLTAYGAAVIYLVINVFLLVRKKDIIRKSRRSAMLFWMLIWVGAALIQFFNNQILIVGFASAIGIMVLYIKLENPEVNLDRQTGLFNQTALSRYTRQLFNKEKSFALVLMVFEYSFYKNHK